MDPTILLGLVSGISALAGGLANKVLDRRTSHEQLAWERVDKLEHRVHQLGLELDKTQQDLAQSFIRERELLARIEQQDLIITSVRRGYQRRGLELAALRAELHQLRASEPDQQGG